MKDGLFKELQKGIQEEWIAQTLREMILIRSENPFEDPPSPGSREKEMAEYLKNHLSRLGLRVEVREVKPSRPNVFGHLPGSEGSFTLMLAGHMDTARTTGYPGAYDVKVEDEMYGRGSCDMKAALAAYLAVVKAMQESQIRLKGNLIVCGNIDEEYQMLGSKTIGQHGPNAHQGIIGEPTNQICPCSKGRVSAKIITRGQAVTGRSAP